MSQVATHHSFFIGVLFIGPIATEHETRTFIHTAHYDAVYYH